jgi:predicted ABC-type ATPase
LRIPYSKVFGRGASGFSSGEDDLENYNSMIDADIRVPATKILKQIIDIRCCQLFGRKIPDLIIKWKPLRVLSEKEEQEIKTSKINSYMQLFQAGIMTKKQVAEKLTNEQIIMFSDDEISNLDEEITEDVMTETKENGKEEQKESILKKIKNAFDDDVIWRTVRGNHIPIKKGKNVREAIREFFENKKREKAGIKTDYQQILDFVNDNNKKNITQEDILNKVLADENFKYSKTEVLRRIKKADEYNRNVVTTDVYHKNPKTGKYYPDRQKKHKEILKEIFANADNAKPEKGQKPIFTVLGGRGGSGKSKFKGLVYNPEKTIVLDADAIKEKLPEYKGYNAFEVHEESSDILNKALKIARRTGLNVVLDGTMKTEKSIKSKLDDFSKKGYEIEMYYMHLPREISAQRAVGRFMGESGRYVPFDVLLGMKENENNFNKLKKYAKKWAFYDNNVATKETPPKLIEKNY